MVETSKFKSGSVALVGRPNVGKSTLMNHLTGQKVVITSNKSQTARNKISGIFTTENLQAVFIDTPGIHKPQNKLDDYMDKASLSSLNDVDLVFFMVGPEKVGKGDEYIADLFSEVKVPIFLIINKTDQVHPDSLLPVIKPYQKLGKFAKIVPISATNGNNMEDLVATLYKYLPEGPQLYDSGEVTDRPGYFVIVELIREQILRLMQQEIPHATAVVVERMNQRVNGKLQAGATVYVGRGSQKKIIIGKGGSMLKKIGIQPRKQAEALLGGKINLHLWVKVQKN